MDNGLRLRRFRRCVDLNAAAACAVLIGAVPLSPTSAADAQDGASWLRTARVYVHEILTDDLPGSTINSVREETTRIWARHRVALTWGRERPDAARGYAAVVPVVFDHSAVIRWREASDREQALARTVFHGRNQSVYVSFRRCVDMLQAARGTGIGLDQEGAREVRIGAFLGRVVAHELGHVLLTSQDHADRGLMRPLYVFDDLLSVSDDATDLTPGDMRRLRMRFSLEPTPAGVLAEHRP